ncbi:HNH endonuclease [Microbacterium sp. MPKO10]|uniref:HNH endonuclease n=1 Tax=Microbacterium sp. MPKO10 TaxID=2989818 RepID=UPI00223642A0|nr:HNH endonuclease signature motif containing protein [Microbacterium sp. MPKO10]MCW4458163.1 HNH endonuclease [Microbacterium sp. MPKO10]
MGTVIPKRVRAIVLERSEGQCERCFSAGPLELHHRKFRSRGGKHTVENLVALCGWGNHTGCHGKAHANGDGGWSVHSWDNELYIPVRDDRGVLWMLGKDGRKHEITEPPF